MLVVAIATTMLLFFRATPTRRLARCGGQRVCLPDRPLGLRQDNAAERYRRFRVAERRHRLRPRPACHRPGTGPRRRLPGICPTTLVHGGAERAVRAAS